MIFIYLIIWIISINGIITKNSSSNRVLIVTLCQANKTTLETIPIINNGSLHSSYFYFTSQPSLTLSFSSSVSSLFHLSYCEHQQTTPSLSSGFSILRSSPRFPLTDIVDKKHSHNAGLSTTDQSLLTSSNTIILMSSTSLHENPQPIDNNYNPIITTTTLSNVSLLHTSLSTTHNLNRTFYIMLIIGCILIGIILIILIYIIIKYCNRDGGSYKVDEGINYVTTPHLDHRDNNICSGKISLSNQQRQKLITTNEQNISDSKEWYV